MIGISWSNATRYGQSMVWQVAVVFFVGGAHATHARRRAGDGIHRDSHSPFVGTDASSLAMECITYVASKVHVRTIGVQDDSTLDDLE